MRDTGKKVIRMQIYRKFGEQMFLWRPYIAFNVYPPKTTETGDYFEKTAITVGRYLKSPQEIERFTRDDKIPTSIKDAVLGSFQKETGVNIKKMGWFDTFKRKIVKGFIKVARGLGVEIYAKDEKIEVYQHVKFNNTFELLEVLTGLLLLIGRQAKIDGLFVEHVMKQLPNIESIIRIGNEK